jgi:transposase
MSTSLVYHAFGAKCHDYLSTEYRGGAVYFHIETKPGRRRCVECRSRDVLLSGRASYPLRALPIGDRRVFLVLHLHVLECKSCGAVRQEDRQLADPRKTYTRAFARLVVDLCEKMTISDVARYVKVGWGLVKAILRVHLERRAKARSWRKVRRIAIDEIAVRKGHHYLTVVVDLDSGKVLFSAEGRDHTCLEPFFRRLRRARAKLKAIAVDMSGAYLKAIKDYGPPGVAVVHDRYHVVSNMNDIIDKVRREEQDRLEAEGKKVIKGSRYLLLTAMEKLAKNPDRQARLNQLLAANETLHKVYLLKEDLRLFWSQDDKGKAEKFIQTWLEQARSLGNRHLSRFAKTIRSRMDAILAYYDHRITTGPLEGLNNKIKVLKRSAYGYRDLSFFALRILFIHDTRFRLSGV